MKKCAAFFILTVTLMLLLPTALASSASAYREEVYTLYDASGNRIASYCGDCSAGDEYISGENRHYRVTSVDESAKTALVADLGTIELPDISWLEADVSLPVSANGKERKIALYCTHSDESYKNGDGKTSDDERGGIYDVAKSLATALEGMNVTVYQSTELHHPHDSGAYRRSRQTAVSLLKNTPDAIFDIHRDGIPDPDEYAVTIGGTEMSKIRLLVGRGNQNNEANLSLAKQLKAVADKIYPKLIKDIYMGKGSYNQDLSPRSVLLEFGTHTLAKKRVLASTKPMSEVIYKVLYGGVTGAAGASDVGGTQNGQNAKSETAATATEDSKGVSSGVVWMIVLLVAGLLVFAFVSTRSGGEGMNKFKRSFSEMTGGLFGKKPPKQ